MMEIALIESTSEKVIRPSVIAFPLTALLLALAGYGIVVAKGVDAMAIFFYVLLPVLSMLLFATYGRSYSISQNRITKTNRIIRKVESTDFRSIVRMQVKPIAFGYGHIVLTLVDGRKLKLKNIKLPTTKNVDIYGANDIKNYLMSW